MNFRMRAGLFTRVFKTLLHPRNKLLYLSVIITIILSSLFVTVQPALAVGQISYVERHMNGESGIATMNSPNDVSVSPDGRHVYVTSYSSSAVTIFERVLSTGELTYIGSVQEGLNGVSGIQSAFGVVVSPDGNNVYIASPTSSAVTVFSRNQSSGLLTFVETHETSVLSGLTGIVTLTISPDGKSVFGVAGNVDGLIVFSRSDTTGRLTYTQHFADNSIDVPGITNALGQAFSPTGSPIKNTAVTSDGSFFYITSTDDNAVMVFSRNTDTGTLTPSSVVQNGAGGVEGISGASSLVLSPDNQFLYVNGQSENSVAVFSRNPSTGALTYAGKVTQGSDGITTLSGARSLAISPDGNYVYVSAVASNTINVFSRNSTTGLLTYADAMTQGVGGVDGITGASGMTTDHQSRNLYATGQNGASLAVFLLATPSVTLSSTTPLSYTALDPALVIDNALTTDDPVAPNFVSAEVKISTGFFTGDILEVTTGGSVTSSYNDTTGTLTLTGTDTLLQYQTILRTVTYRSTSGNPTNSGVFLNKDISFTVSNGQNGSSAAIRTIVIPAPEPEISLEGNAIEILDGDSTPSTGDHTDFGTVNTASGTVTRTFTIKNTGDAGLTLGGDPKVAITGTHAGDFTVAVQPSSPVAVSDSTTFQVTFDPSADGLRTASLSITNNDSNENPYDFAIQGTGSSTTPLTVSGITADNKIYDGTTLATLNTGGASLVGVSGGDDVSISVASATGTFSDKNTGSGKTVTVSGLTLTGTDAGDYSLTQPTTTADITARTLTVTASGSNKVYDGTTTTTVTLSDNRISGDTITTGYSAAAFDSKNIGAGKTVSVTGIAISGTDATNYALASTTASTTADVTTRTLTVTASGSNKVYDGTTAAAVTFSDNRIGGDTVTIGYTATFDSKNVGTGKTVSVTGITLGGTDATNYTLASTAMAATADISVQSLTVTAVTDSKNYDGTVVSGQTPLIIAGTIGAGDSAVWTQTFDSKNTGTGKTITPAGTITDGNGGNNYTITYASVTNGVISQKPLVVSGVTATNKTYSGNTSATLNIDGISLTGVVGGDNVILGTSGVSANFADKTAGIAKTVTISGLSITGSDAANYILTQPVVTADITKKDLSVSGITAADKTFDSTVTATIDTSNTLLAGLFPGDNVTLDVSSATGVFSDPNPGNNKTVIISGCSISGSDSVNYSLIQPTVTASIQPQVSGGGGGSGIVIPEEEEQEPEEEATDTEPLPDSSTRVIATVDPTHEPTAVDTGGKDITVTGNFITISEEQNGLTLNIPIALDEGAILDSFTDAAGITYEQNILRIPASSEEPGASHMLEITDDTGTNLNAEIVIETDNCVGSGGQATATLRSITTDAGFTSKDLTGEDSLVGVVASKISLDLATLPEEARVVISTSIEADENADSAFHLTAAEQGMDAISIAYTINVEKININNGTDIQSASISMVVSTDWVAANGGYDAIRIIRYDSDTGMRQMLETRLAGHDDQGRAIFEALSPDGLSVFALVGTTIEPEQRPSEEAPVSETDLVSEDEDAEPTEIIGEGTPVITQEKDNGTLLWLLYLIIALGLVSGITWRFVLKDELKEEIREFCRDCISLISDVFSSIIYRFRR